MATRSHTTFQKRQKELARMEKQRDKVEKRNQRKLEKPEGEVDDSISMESTDRATQQEIDEAIGRIVPVPQNSVGSA
jgi:hypothetical protein